VIAAHRIRSIRYCSLLTHTSPLEARMRQWITIVGILTGFILFMVAAIWHDGLLRVVLPLTCADGTYEGTDSSVRQNNRDVAATAEWCRQPDGTLSPLGGYMVAGMALACIVPAGLGIALGWLISKITPKPQAKEPGFSSGEWG
jgi:hypothetical protein